MPHIVLETTADLPENADVPDILEALTQTVSGIDSVNPAAIKAYHTLRPTWCTGKGGPDGFAHCTVAILSGRPIEWREQLADAILRTLEVAFESSLDAGEATVTLEIREMTRETYRTLRRDRP